LEVLDPAQNDSFTDHYLGVPYDLSEVLFIATANFRANIPEPLLDRMEVVEFTGYTELEKLAIARRYLLPRQLQEAGLGPEELELADDAMREVISRYTREAGVRQLERELGKIARKVARRIAAIEIQAPWSPNSLPGACFRRRPGRRGNGHVLHPRWRRHHVRRSVGDGWIG
jgi:ATP-dependent Lon protease